MVLDIGGIAATPRLSENNTFYWPQELKKFHGHVVPLRLIHQKDGGVTVGEAKFSFDEEDRQLMYQARIKNEEAIKAVKAGGWKVSIGALTTNESKNDKICHRDGTCASSPQFNKIIELALVKNPGMPESTLEIFESKADETITLHCESKHEITSDECPLNTNCNNMAENTTKVEETEPVKGKFEEDPCPPGWKLVDGKCVKQEAPAPAEEKTETESETSDTKTVDINVNVTKNEEKTEEKTEKVDIETLKTEMKADILKEMGEKFTPKSDVKTGDSGSDIVDWKKAEADKYTPEYVREKLDNGKLKMVINKEDWISENSQNLVTEAVSTSGTIAQVKSTTDVIIIPGSNTFEPIRSLGQFEALKTGEDKTKFWTLNVAAFGTATGVIDGKIGTVGAHNLKAIEVSTAPRGVLQQVTKDQLRDFPPKFMEKLKEVMRLAAIKDEHNLIVQTLASTDNDFNNGTTAVTADFPVHLRGDTGALVDNGTTEDAVAEMAPIGLQRSRRYLAQRGHNPVSNRLVAIISSRAYDALINSSDITRFIQEGNPAISEQGLLSRYFGIEIMVSEELLVANNSQRNLVLVAGKAFALASQKEMSIEMQEQIEGQYVNIVATHDIGVEELDHSAYTIISSKND